MFCDVLPCDISFVSFFVIFFALILPCLDLLVVGGLGDNCGQNSV